MSSLRHFFFFCYVYAVYAVYAPQLIAWHAACVVSTFLALQVRPTKRDAPRATQPTFFWFVRVRAPRLDMHYHIRRTKYYTAFVASKRNPPFVLLARFCGHLDDLSLRVCGFWVPLQLRYCSPS